MRGVDEAREPVRPAVRRMRREGVEPVVAPVAIPGERRDGHRLDRRDAELAQLREARDHAVERPLGRERADVQLVEDELVEARLRAGRDVEARACRGRATARARPRAGSASTDRATPRRRRRRGSRRRPAADTSRTRSRRPARSSACPPRRCGPRRAGIRRPHAELDSVGPTGIAPSCCIRARLPVRHERQTRSRDPRGIRAGCIAWEDRHRRLIARLAVVAHRDARRST